MNLGASGGVPPTASGGVGGTFAPPGGSHCPSMETAVSGDAPMNTLDCAGVIHRSGNAACPPWPLTPEHTLAATGLDDQCLRDADCTAKPSGYCSNDTGAGGREGNQCHYQCATDADCSPHAVCDCRGNTCVDASCATDATCDPGKMCVLWRGYYDAQVRDRIPYYDCQTADDQCTPRSPSDCPAGLECRRMGDRFACLNQVPIP